MNKFEKILICARAGMAPDAIALTTGFAPDFVERRLAWADKVAEEEKRRRLILELRQDGMKQADIAQKIGITQQRVSQILRDADMPGRVLLEEKVRYVKLWIDHVSINLPVGESLFAELEKWMEDNNVRLKPDAVRQQVAEVTGYQGSLHEIGLLAHIEKWKVENGFTYRNEVVRYAMVKAMEKEAA